MVIRTVADLAPHEERAVDIILDWAGDGPVDWEDMLDRIERNLDLDLPTDMTDPVIRRIQRLGREALREARS